MNCLCGWNEGFYADGKENGIHCFKCDTWQSRFPYDPNIYRGMYESDWIARASSPEGQVLYADRARFVAEQVADLGMERKRWLDFGGGFASYPEIHFHPTRHIERVVYDPMTIPEVKLTDFGPIDILSFFDSMEHLPEPTKVIDLYKPKLVLLSIPIVPISDLIYSKHYKPKEHLWMFSERGLHMMFSRLGYEQKYLGYEQPDLRENIYRFAYVKD